MKIANLSVYKLHKLLGYLLLGIAAYAFVNANNTDLQATATVSEEQTQSNTNRHTITLALSQLSDLKVEEGQRINVGEIISDMRSIAEGIALPKKPNYMRSGYPQVYPLGEAKKQRLADSLTRAKLPLNQLKSVPVPQFQTELASLKQAQFNLDAIVKQINNFDQKIYHKDPWHVQVFESEKVQQLADLKRKELEASINVERAIASLDEAKLNYRRQQYLSDSMIKLADLRDAHYTKDHFDIPDTIFPQNFDPEASGMKQQRNLWRYDWSRDTWYGMPVKKEDTEKK